MAIFESPTGTGKSLSLICASLQWLQDYQSKSNSEQVEEKLREIQQLPTDEPDWVRQFQLKKKKEELLLELNEIQAKKEARKARLDKMRRLKRSEGGVFKKVRLFYFFVYLIKLICNEN